MSCADYVGKDLRKQLSFCSLMGVSVTSDARLKKKGTRDNPYWLPHLQPPASTVKDAYSRQCPKDLHIPVTFQSLAIGNHLSTYSSPPSTTRSSSSAPFQSHYEHDGHPKPSYLALMTSQLPCCDSDSSMVQVAEMGLTGNIQGYE
jgi:hypothetical protein